MPDENKNNKLCLAIGAGAIGKSITGYIFRKHDLNVIFADVVDDVIDDINRRNEYVVHSTQTGENSEDVIVRNVTAYYVSDPAVIEIAINADYICTAVGASGLKILLPTFIEWMNRRNDEQQKKLYLLLFENDTECVKIITDGIENRLGFLPEWLSIIKTSVERMTKPDKNAENEFNVIAEQFIPVIASKEQLIGSSIESFKDSFELVENVDAYYYRKLYTNNLGHVVLGYIGLCHGYENTIQAMNDPLIYNHLTDVLNESGKMLEMKYGFTENEMKMHIDSLLMRYRNEELKDSLQRLARDPLRKLGRKERITGAIYNCIEYDINPDAIIKTLFYALHYRDLNDPSVCILSEILGRDGIGGVLTQICGMHKNDRVFNIVCKLYADFVLNE